MSGVDWFGIVLLYCIIGASSGLATIAIKEEYIFRLSDRARARIILAAFVWPLTLIWWIITKGAARLGRGIGWVFKNALGPE